jgi:hypothetical protein
MSIGLGWMAYTYPHDFAGFGVSTKYSERFQIEF